MKEKQYKWEFWWTFSDIWSSRNFTFL